MPNLTRRAFLAANAGALAGIALRGASGRGWMPGLAPARFQLPLAIPSVLRPIRSSGDTDYYEITQREAQVELLPGLSTTIWGYEGQFPGPTIRARRGRTAAIHHVNRLTTPTVVHLHGGATPPASDGFPVDLVAPGAAKTYVYPNNQRAATLWYHDHAIDHTGRNIFMGLAGLYLIEDDESASLPLPRDEYDIPLLIQDRYIGSDGAFQYRPDWIDGPPTNTVLVNGTPWPHLDVAARKYRFRILNASNARSLTLALSPSQPFVQIATDGGLLAAPAHPSTIPLAMAERVEIVLDFAAFPIGSHVFLVDQRPGDPLGAVVRFNVVRPARDDSTVPQRLSDIPRLSPDTAAHTRTIMFTRGGDDSRDVHWAINFKEFNPDAPLLAPARGDVEIWRLMNHTFNEPHSIVHPVHIHLTQFQILERNGAPALPHEIGWKDTVRLETGDDVRVIAKFDGERGRYLMHCHNLEHEDRGMMARYDVV